MKPRTFDREFKLQVVRQLLSGEKRLSQLCREHNLCASLVRTWRQQYEQKGEDAWLVSSSSVQVMTREHERGPVARHDEAKDARIAALEAALGRAHLENEFLRQALAKKASPQTRRLL
jgi:transposase-like protein